MIRKKKMFWKQILIFNRPAFISSALLITLCIFLLLFFGDMQKFYKIILGLIIFGAFYFSIVSILFSYFIYDRSDLYKFNWLKPYLKDDGNLFNVYSGYSEGGHILNKIFVQKRMTHFDFFDHSVSVTGSIQKAQSVSEPIKNIPVIFNDWKVQDKATTILFMQSLHELRKKEQKIECLNEAACHLSPGGKLIVTEHLCDIKNFLIYGPGAFHFFGKRHWKGVFKNASLKVSGEFNITPFVKIYILSE